MLRVIGPVRPPRRAGLGRKHDARRVRRADRHPRERTRLRPVQPVLRAGADADRVRRSGGCAGPATARSVCTRSIAASSAATWRCRRSGSSAFSGARRSAGAHPALLSGPRSGRRHPADRRSRGTARPSSSRSRWAITAPGWQKGPPIDPDIAGLFDPSEIPDGAGLLRYLDGLRRSDEMLQMLIGELERRGGPAVLGILRRPSAEPAARLRPFRLHRDIVRLCDLERRRRHGRTPRHFRRTSLGRP